MAHDHHFLSRLDRVSSRQCELALSLYRDDDLVREILVRAAIPESAERVAIALEPGPRTPHVIVARNGHFVTCLGEGMSVGPHPVISRAKLDEVAAQVYSLRARIEVANELTGRDEGKLHALYKRVLSAGPFLAREELLAVSSLAPIVGSEFLNEYVETAVAVTTLGRRIAQYEAAARREHRLLRGFWSLFWGTGHLAVLASMDGPHLVEALPAEAKPKLHSYGYGAFGLGVVGVSLRGLWSTAQIGEPLLEPYERAYENAGTFLETLHAGLGLIALAARRPALRGPVHRCLAAHRDVRVLADDPSLLDALVTTRKLFCRVLDERPERCEKAARDIGAELWARTSRRLLPLASPYRYERAEEVPDDLARAAVFLHSASFRSPTAPKITETLATLFQLTGWVARAKVEETYLPLEAASAIHDAWSPEATLALADLFRDEVDREEPVRVEHREIGRNDACPCGSGNKYKKCCLA